nr:GDSL-type esterase/lipase family protein [Flavihumibacter rivuli]
MFVKRLYLFVVFSLLVVSGFAQEPPFFRDIQAFKRQDSIAPPPANQILFIGSSSFTYWKDVQDYFPKHRIINRGFGGSSLPDLIRYANEIIFPYSPRQIVIYCGENDLAASDTVSAATVIERFQTLYSIIRSRLPLAEVTFVSLKPSPSRQHLFPKMMEVNAGVKAFLKKKKWTSFVDVFSKMLNADGAPMEDLFVNDRLHMNPKGYAIWKREIEPKLIK